MMLKQPFVMAVLLIFVFNFAFSIYKMSVFLYYIINIYS